MLTDVAIRKIGPSDKRCEVPDGKVSGLYLVVQPSGAKSWALRYRIYGASRKLTLGPYPGLDLAEARRKAQEAIGDIARGKDPAAEKKVVREEQRAANSPSDRVEAIVAQFVQKHLAKKAKPSWAKEAERLLRVEIVSKWGERKLGEIKRADVRRLLEDIAERAPITANRTLATFRKLCNWAVAQEIISASPCVGLEAPTEERTRERVLSDDEIRLAWNAFGACGWPFGEICRLLILTGARRDEVAGMRWSELELASAKWTLPPSRTKNRREHIVPLTDAAMRIIEGLPRIEGKEGLVFTTTGRSSVSGFSNAKAAIDRAVLKALREEAEARGEDPVAVMAPSPWVVHDLRRTVATGLQRLGTRLEVTEACLNHVSGSRGGIVGVYQRHEYFDEKRAALQAWAKRLERIVVGGAASNVVVLAEARG